MKIAPRRLPVALLVLSSLLLFTAADWLQFRGTDNNGVAVGPEPPVRWDEKKHIAWRADLPGRAVCGPIVVAGKVVLTASSGYRRDRLHLLCFDVKTGKLDWERQFWATGRTFCHPTSAVAANTPCSDGRNIYALFSSNDLVCLDLEGNLQWLRGLGHDYPKAGNDVGMSSSPVVIGETVVVQIEAQGDSFVAGINTATGKTRWRKPRPRMSNWASPTVHRGKTRNDDVVLLQSSQTVEAVRPATGDVVWRHETECGVAPSITTDGETIFVPTDGLTAFRGPAGSAAKKLVWSQSRLGPSYPSPVARNRRVYVLKGSVLACGDTKSGEVLWQTRVRGRRFWATPVVTQKHLFLANADGLVQVVDISGKDGKIVGSNDLGEPIFGTPAISDGAIYVRSHKHLWKIAKP